LYPALSSIAKIKNIARKAKFIIRKFGKSDKGLYVCGVRRAERLVQDESEFD
jgi:hypothetical protein